MDFWITSNDLWLHQWLVKPTKYVYELPRLDSIHWSQIHLGKTINDVWKLEPQRHQQQDVLHGKGGKKLDMICILKCSLGRLRFPTWIIIQNKRDKKRRAFNFLRESFFSWNCKTYFCNFSDFINGKMLQMFSWTFK